MRTIFRVTLVIISLFNFQQIEGRIPRRGLYKKKIDLLKPVDDIKEVNYQVSIELKGHGHVCSGLYLNPIYILTSARCVYNQATSNVTVRAGSLLRNLGGVTKNVSQITIHPRFNSKGDMEMDVALLELHSPLPNNKEIVQAIPMVPINWEPRGFILCRIAGWGYNLKNNSAINILSETPRLADKIAKTDVPLFAQYDCRVVWAEHGRIVSDDMLCAGTKIHSKSTCISDHGSPLICNKMVVGLASWGGKCEKENLPSIYTFLASPNIRSFVASMVG